MIHPITKPQTPYLKGARDKSLREDVTGGGGRGGRIWLRLREFLTIRLATETSRMRAGAAAAGGDDMLSGTACSDGAGGKVCSLEDVMSVMGAGEGALASEGGGMPDIVEECWG
jgi:hypothetical protein